LRKSVSRSQLDIEEVRNLTKEKAIKHNVEKANLTNTINMQWGLRKLFFYLTHNQLCAMITTMSALQYKLQAILWVLLSM